MTVGTTKFEKLIECVDTEEVLDALERAGYTSLTLQIGHGEYEPRRAGSWEGALKVEHFRLTPSLDEYMDESDLVISHAGAGSLFEALNAGRRVIAVPNPTLMVNHQEELASHLADRGFLLHAAVVPESVARAIGEMERASFKAYEPMDARRIVAEIDALL